MKKYQYYWKQDGCNASSASDMDCLCWHDAGTGPCKDEKHAAETPLVEWRIKPSNAQIKRRAQHVRLNDLLGVMPGK